MENLGEYENARRESIEEAAVRAINKRATEIVQIVARTINKEDPVQINKVYLLVNIGGSQVLAFTDGSRKNTFFVISEEGIKQSEYSGRLTRPIHLNKHPDITLPLDTQKKYSFMNKRGELRHYASGDGSLLYNISDIGSYLSRSGESKIYAGQLLDEVERICKSSAQVKDKLPDEKI